MANFFEIDFFYYLPVPFSLFYGILGLWPALLKTIELWNQLNFDSIIEPYFSEEEETYCCEECGNQYYKSD